MTGSQHQESNYVDDMINLKDIQNSLQNIRTGMSKTFGHIIHLIQRQKKIFGLATISILFITSLFVFLKPQQYQYVQVINVASYGTHLPVQSAKVVVARLQNEVIPQMIAHSKNKAERNFLMSLKLSTYDTKRADNPDNLDSDDNLIDRTHVMINGKAPSKEKPIIQLLLNQLLQSLQSHQTNTIDIQKQLLQKQLMLAKNQLAAFNAITPQKLATSFHDRSSADRTVSESGIIPAKMFAAVELNNILLAQKTLFDLQNQVMLLNFDLNTLKASQFSSQLGETPLNMHKILMLMLCVLAAMMIGILISSMTEYFQSNKISTRNKLSY